MLSFVSPVVTRCSNGEIYENDARIRRVRERCAVETDERDRVCRARSRQNDIRGTSNDGVSTRESRSWRKLQGHDQVGPIERRNEACRRRCQPIVGHIEQPGISNEQDHADADQLTRQPRIAMRQASKHPVEAAEEQTQWRTEVVESVRGLSWSC